jgi:hypothetical protein
MISDKEIERIADRISERIAERIAGRVAALLRATTVPDRIAVGIEELQPMLGCNSKSATYRELEKLGVRAYSPGKYRRADVENAVARKSHQAAKEHSSRVGHGAQGDPATVVAAGNGTARGESRMKQPTRDSLSTTQRRRAERRTA